MPRPVTVIVGEPSSERVEGLTSVIAVRDSGGTFCSSRRLTIALSRSTREPAKSDGI